MRAKLYGCFKNATPIIRAVHAFAIFVSPKGYLYIYILCSYLRIAPEFLRLVIARNDTEAYTRETLFLRARGFFCRGEYEISFVGEEVRRDLHGALLWLEHSNEYHSAAGHSRLPTVQSAAAW